MLFSDGVTEAMDPEEKEFGISRLKEVLKGQANASVEASQSAILAAIEEFAHGARQADDVTLLLVRYQRAAQAADVAAASR